MAGLLKGMVSVADNMELAVQASPGGGTTHTAAAYQLVSTTRGPTRHVEIAPGTRSTALGERGAAGKWGNGLAGMAWRRHRGRRGSLSASGMTSTTLTAQHTGFSGERWAGLGRLRHSCQHPEEGDGGCPWGGAAAYSLSQQHQ